MEEEGELGPRKKGLWKRVEEIRAVMGEVPTEDGEVMQDMQERLLRGCCSARSCGRRSSYRRSRSGSRSRNGEQARLGGGV